ncbi:hypothetical protein [Pseudomonas sp. 3JA]
MDVERVIFMNKGEIVEQAAPNDFLDNQQSGRTKLFLSISCVEDGIQ